MSTDWAAVPFPDLSHEQLHAICDSHGLGLPPIGRLPSTGVVNSIYTLGDDYVLRVPKNFEPALSDTYTESVAVPVAHKAGVRTPALVVWDESFDILEVPYAIYERVHAAPLTGAAGPWEQVGRDLAKLHEGVSHCPDPRGRLDQAGRDVVQWTAADEPSLPPDVAAWADRVAERLRPYVLATAPVRFVHNDVQPSNVLAKAGDYAAVIDWGDAGWGDPTVEFAVLPMRAAERALRGYREVLALEDERTEACILWDHLVGLDEADVRADLIAFAADAPEPWRSLLAR